MELFDWQRPFADRTCAILSQGNVCLLALVTGSGKTYIASHAAHQLGRPALVLCPKNVITMWHEVLSGFGVNALDVLNWEKIKTRKTRWLDKDNKWVLPSNALVIVDEIHRGASGYKTQTTEAMGRLKAYPDVKVLGSSATIADSPLKMRAIGYLLGLHRYNTQSFFNWCRENGCSRSPFHQGYEFPRGPKGATCMALIHRQIADRMIKCGFDDIPGFPESLVQPTLYDLDTEYREEIGRIYKEMAEELKQPGDNPLVIQLRARQRTELLKAPLLVDLAEDALAESKSVVLFVGFRETLKRIAYELSSHGVSVIYGDQKLEERDAEIRAFQENKNHVCVSMIQAGGVALSLHDVKHERPRVSYITPTFNASEVIQALGRIHRVGGTNVVQQFVLISGTVEEKIYKAIKQKSLNINSLQDGDLML